MNRTKRMPAGIGPVFAVVLLGLVAAGCPPGEPTGMIYQDQEITDVGAPDVADLGETEAIVVPTIDGVWLHYSQMSTCVSLLTLVEEGISRILYIVEASENEQRVVTETWLACSQDLIQVLGLDTYVTEALLDGAYPVTTTEGFVTTTEIGGAYTSGLLPELWGCEFDDPIHDPFPESIDDPRVVDSDNDGLPGVTVLVSDLCQRYQAQRALTSFWGYYVAPDRIEGPMLSTNEQLALGGSSDFCGTSYETRPNDVRSQFERIRIDGQGGALNLDANDDGTITCDEVLPYTETLFEKILPDDANCFVEGTE